MGLIKVDRHDAFISYTSRDNIAYGNLIKGIRHDLRERFQARYTEPPDIKADFFIDSIGMPANGLPSDELYREIAITEFLFIFMSDCYLDSEFCGKELDWFRECCGGERKHALNRTIIIILEEKAKYRHWREFLEKPERPKFVELYDEEGNPLKRFLQAEGYKAVLNPAYEAKLDWIAETMISRVRNEKVASKIQNFSKDERILNQRLEKLRRIGSKLRTETYIEIEKDIARRYVFGEN